MKLLLNINHAGDTAVRPGDELQGTLIISGIASQKRPNCTATIGGNIGLPGQPTLYFTFEADKTKPHPGRLMISVPAQVAGPNIDNAVYTVRYEPPSSLTISHSSNTAKAIRRNETTGIREYLEQKQPR